MLAQQYGENQTHLAMQSTGKPTGWMDGWLGFNGILSTQVAAISCKPTTAHRQELLILFMQ